MVRIILENTLFRKCRNNEFYFLLYFSNILHSNQFYYFQIGY